eukprot:605986-Pleurochrysis_carterae.AAC.1
MHLEEINASHLRVAAIAGRQANDGKLLTDALQDRQPNKPSPLDDGLVGKKLEVRWLYILSSPSAANSTAAKSNTYMWCEGEVVSVVSGLDRRDRARCCLPAPSTSSGPPTVSERKKSCMLGHFCIHRTGIKICKRVALGALRA